jgi:hypothetical protein
VPAQHEVLVGGRGAQHLAHQAEQPNQQPLARTVLGRALAARRLRER